MYFRYGIRMCRAKFHAYPIPTEPTCSRLALSSSISSWRSLALRSALFSNSCCSSRPRCSSSYNPVISFSWAVVDLNFLV